MILSLITLCAVMLFMEDRIARFLHGGSEPAPENPGFPPDMAFVSDWGETLARFWQDSAGFVTSAVADVTDQPDDGKVVITEDTLKQVWVWREDGTIESAPKQPPQGDARKVMIPRNMTAREFFGDADADKSAAQTAQPNDTPDSPADEPASAAGGTDTGTPLDSLSAEERRAMLNQGMEVLEQQSSGPAGASRP